MIYTLFCLNCRVRPTGCAKNERAQHPSPTHLFGKALVKPGIKNKRKAACALGGCKHAWPLFSDSLSNLPDNNCQQVMLYA